MYNQTECQTTNSNNNEMIVSIVISSLSFLSALGTFAYFKISSKFKDMQHSEVKITTSQNKEEKKTTIKVKFINDENFEMSAQSRKNGKEENSSSVFNKVTDRLLATSSFENSPKSNVDIESPEFLSSSFSNAMNNNNLGDQIIADTRKGLILHALNTFLKTVKIYNVSEEEIMVISNNNSKNPSVANNLLYHKEVIDSVEIADDDSFKELIVPLSNNKNESCLKDKKEKFNNLEELDCQSTKPIPALWLSPDIQSSPILFHSHNHPSSKSDTFLKYDNVNKEKIKSAATPNIEKSKSFNDVKMQNLNKEPTIKLAVHWQKFDNIDSRETEGQLDAHNTQIIGQNIESDVYEN